MLINIQLSSGRTVFLTGFECSGTYDSLLEGWPTVEINKSVIDSTLRKARHLWSKAGSPVHMIEPVCTPNPHEGSKTFTDWVQRILRSGNRPAPWLPPVNCIANLQSSPKDKTDSWTWLVVVWFQNPFFDQPLQDVLKKALENIPWDKNAKQFDF
jgi:hypothetical protein